MDQRVGFRNHQCIGLSKEAETFVQFRPLTRIARLSRGRASFVVDLRRQSTFIVADK
jgi:hypothetical protein